MNLFYKLTFVTAVFLIIAFAGSAQTNSVSIGTTSTNASAVLWLNSPGSNQGLIIPVGNRTSVATPAKGMLIFDTNQVYAYDGSGWNTVGGSGSTYSLSYNASTKVITLNPNSSGTATIDISTTALSGGDLGGTLATPTVGGIQGKAITLPNSGVQYLAYDATQSKWVFQTPTGSGDMLKATYDSNNDGTVDKAASLTTTLPLANGGTGITTVPTANQVLTTNGSSTVGWTNISALPSGSGPILSATQVLTGNGTTNSATVLAGDASINAGSMTVKGLQTKALPSLPATFQYLAYDGTTSSWKFQTPSGSGDMLKSTYDINTDNIVDAAASLTTTLPLAKGGTGITTTPTANQLLATNGSSVVGWTGITGDVSLSSGAMSVSGLQSKALPSLPATLQYLAYDGTTSSWKFQTPSGSGDMLKSTYDINTDNIVDAAASLTTTLPLAKGGTGITTTPTANQLLATNGSSVVGWTGITGDVSLSSGALSVSGLQSKPLPSLPATLQYLAYDGTTSSWKFQTLSGSGDMLKATYDINTDNIVDAAASLTTTLPLTKGGTGITITPTANQILTTNGSSAPTWANSIAGSQVTPNFVAQPISTTGTLSSGATTVTGLTVSGAATKFNGLTYFWPLTLTAGNFLQTDGAGNLTWAPLTGGGNMSTTTYDTNANGIVDNSEKIGGSAWPTAAASSVLLNDGTGALSWANFLPIANGGTGAGTAALALSNLGGVSLGGDLGGTTAAPTISKIQGSAWPSNAAGVLTNNGSGTLSWGAAGLSSTLSSANIFVGNGSNVATAVPLTGDAGITNTGLLTIANNAITSAKISNGTIVDADISATGISTAGKVSGNAITSGTIGGSTIVNTSGDISTTGTGKLSVAGTTTFGTKTYTWPSTALVANTFLSTDAGGNLSWVNTPSPFSTNNIIPKGNGTGLTSSLLNDNGTGIGIGTSTPATEFQIDASQPTVRLRSTTASSLSQSWVEFGHDDGSGGFTKVGAIGDTGSGDNLYLFSPNNILFNSNFADRFAIGTSGELGAGSPLSFGSAGQVLTSAGNGATAKWTSLFNTNNVVPKGDGTTLTSSLIYDDGTHVGIGTTTPNQTLDVAGNFNLTGAISGGNNTGAQPQIAYGYNTTASGGFGSMAVGYIASATGTVSTAIGQSVVASGYDAVAIGQNVTATGNTSIALGNSITVNGDYSVGIGLSGGGAIVNSPNAMAIMGGNVGIGNSAPAYPLDVKATNYGISHSDGTATLTTYVGSGGGLYGGSIGTQTDHPFFVYIGNSGPKFMISNSTNSYNVGIGNVAPAYKLDVTGDIRTSGYYYFSGNSGASPAYKQYIFGVAGSYMGTTDHFIPNNSNTQDLGTSSFRWRTVYTNNTVNVSDLRLKKNISPLNYGLSEILKLKPVSYVMKDDKEEEVKLGLIAQEVQKLVPEVVLQDNNSSEKYLGMNYTELIPVLIKAVQEQQKLIDDQKKLIEELKGQQNQKETTTQSELNQLKAEIRNIKKTLGVETSAKKK